MKNTLRTRFIKSSIPASILIILQLIGGFVYGQTPVPMASQSGLTYTENFSAIASWSNNFTGSATGESRWKGIAFGGSGTIPTATHITQNSSNGSTVFASGSGGGVQKGSGNIQLLVTGTGNSTDATAVDFFMDFTGVNAGSLSFDVAEVANSTGDRPATLKVYYSTDGTTFTELTATNLPFTSSNNVAHSATVTVALPAAFNNSATARLRFYQYNGPGVGTTGSRPKHSITNITVTAVSSNTAPTFTTAHALTVCQNASATAINSILTVSDVDASQTETWTVPGAGPLHGTLAGFPATHASGGSSLSPAGLTYSPTTGFSGTDTFTVKVSDGTAFAAALVTVTVNPLPTVPGTITGTANVCAGGAITTLSDPTSGGSWSSLNTSVATVGTSGTSTGVTGVTAGTSLISYTISNSCGSAATTLTVTVNPLPVTGPITGTAVVCESGGTTTLSDTSSAGTWSSTNTTVATVTAIGVVTGVHAGTSTISYTVTGSCGPVPATAVVTVNPLPSPTISGSTTISSGGTATLSFSGTNGDVLTYSWTGGGSGSTTIGGTGNASAGVSPTVTTTYSITAATSSAGCMQTISGQFATITISTASPSDTIPTRDDNMAMGNPSGATSITSNANNYLMIKSQYALSYNNSKGEPNWVSWHLSTAWKGPAPRCNCFTQDATLPSGYFVASSSDYTSTGFDRGHLCPSEDRDASDTDNAATFKMTNMTPQAPNMNEVTWESFESYCRDLMYAGNELYIIAGGYGSGGTGNTGGTTTTIGGTSINVPARFFKVALILPVGINDVSRVTTSTRVIAVDMPNTQSVSNHPWTYYRTSVDAIEAATGYDFLSNVPVPIQAVIEAGVDNGPSALVAWDFTGHNGDATVAATMMDSTLNTSFNTVTRGSGASASSGGNSFRTTGFQNNGISTSNTDYFQTTIKAGTGYKMSLSGIDATFAGTASFCASPGVTSQFAYSLNGTTFTLINSPITSVGSPSTISTVDLSGITALQNVPATTTVYFRYYASGQTTSGGWGFYSSDTGYNGFSIAGTTAVDPGCSSAPTAVSAGASPVTLCSGSALTLTGSATGATSYSWSGPNGFTSSLQNPASFATSTASAGSYTFSATNGCGTNTVTTSAVTVNTVPAPVIANSSATTLCSGGTLTLSGTATGATTYSWSGPNGFTSTSLNPAAITVGTTSSGIYTLTATNTCGNTIATTSLVAVNTVPTNVTATPSAATLCSGATLTLTGAATGATAYSWSGPNAFGSSVLNPASITTGTASAGAYTLSATNSCGSTPVATSAITINTVPTSVTASASAATLCSGATLTLSGTATGASSYSWNGPNGFTSTNLNPAAITVGTASAGIYTLVATNSCGNTTVTTSAVVINTVPINVTVTPSATTLCSGAPLTLTGTATAAAGYNWSGPNGFTSSVLNPAAITTNTASAGIYTLVATNSCGSTSVTTAAITINTVPTSVTASPSATTLCTGGTLTISGGASGAATYLWNGPNSFTSTSLNPATITVGTASSGVYTLTATNSCGNTTATTALVAVNAAPANVIATPSATTLCSGSALTLSGSATGATGYTWSGPGGFTSLVLNPAAITTGTASAGVYTLVATNSCGSATVTTSAITINTVPTSVTAIPSATTLCSGASLTLTATATGATSFAWSGPNGFTSTNLNPSAFTTGTLSAGIYTLTASNTCGNTTAVTAVVSINDVPSLVTASAAPATLCNGASLTLNGAATAAASYSWSGPNGFTSTDVNPASVTVNTASSGIYSLTATNSCGNATGTTVSVLVNDIPQSVSASTPSAVCDGSSLTVTGSASGADSYSWSGPNGFTSTDLNPASITANSLSAGVYSLTAANSCGSAMAATGAVAINSVPSSVAATASATSICVGAPLTLSGVATNAVSYSWSSPGGYTATDANPPAITVNPASAGIYTLTATNAFGNTSASTISVTVNPTPAPSMSGSAIIALGASTTITISGVAGDVVTFTWTGGGTSTATLDGTGANSFTVSPSATTTYSITTATSSFGCTAAITGASATVTVDLGCTTAPTSVTAALSVSTVCSGDAVTVTGSATNALGYSWSGPNGFTATDLNPTSFITNTASAGIYTLTATNACGSTSASTAALFVGTTPSAVSATPSAITLCSGAVLTLAGAASSAVSYSWSGPNGFTSTDLNPASFTVSTASAGVYTLTASNACGSTNAVTVTVNVSDVPSGVSAIPSSLIICNGASFTLSGNATGAATYSWSGPNGFTSTDQNPAAITVNSASVGVYSLTATNSCGSVMATTASITISDIPSGVSATPSGTVFCAGAVLTLTGTAVGASTYSWSGPNGFISTGLSPAAITVGTASSGIYSLSTGNACGNVVATTAAVIVNGAPTGLSATPSSILVCDGASLLLTSGATGANAYSWNGPGGYTSTDQNPVAFTVNTGSAGVYTVIATSSCGSATATTAPVIVNSVPTAASASASATVVCNGAVLTLTGSATGATSYSWSGPDGFNSTLNPASRTINTLSAGIYTVTAINGCGNTTATTASVTVNQGPSGVSAVASPIAVCSGATLTLAGVATGATSYSWNGPGGFTSTLQNPAAITTSSTTAGVYTFTATSSCGSASVATSAVAVIGSPTVAAITGTTSVAIGGTVTLSDATTSGTWSSLSTSVATVNTGGGVRGVAGGTTTISYTVSNSCGSAYAIAIVTVNATTSGIAPTTWGGTTPNGSAGPSAFSPLPASTSPGTAAIAVSQWDRSGISFNAGAGRYNSSSFTTGASSVAAQFAAGKYLFFTVTNNSSTQLIVTGVAIGTGQASGTGPTTFGLMYKIGAGTATQFGTNGAVGGPSPSFTSTGIFLCAGQTATFYLSGWGGTGGSGTWSINSNASITGQYTTAVGATAANSSPVLVPGPINFTGNVSAGVAPYTYSWSGPGTFVNSLVANATINPSSPGNAGNYSLTVTDAWGCKAVATSSVTIAPGTACSGTPTAGIAGAATTNICTSGSTTLSATGGSFVSGLAYQWQSSSDSATWTNISGATNTTYVAPTFTATTFYRMKSTCVSSALTDSTNGKKVTVTHFISNPSGSSIIASNGTTFSVVADGAVTYQWQRSTTGTGGTYSNITSATMDATGTYSGFTSPTLTLATVPITWNNYAYRCVITNTCGSVTSGNAPLIVSLAACAGAPTAGTAIAGTSTFCTSGSTTISTSGTTSAAGLTYQWQSSPDSVSWTTISGATNLTYTTPTITLTTFYRMQITCTAAGLSDSSSGARVKLNYLPAPGVITGTQLLCVAGTTTLSDTAAAGSWTSGTTSVATVNSTGLVSGVTAGTSIISYSLTNGCGTTRATATVTVNNTPGAVIISPGVVHLCPTSPAATLTASGAAVPFSASAASGVISVNANAGSSTGTASLSISGVPVGATITGVSVTLNFNSNFMDDYVLNLQAPNGSVLNLINGRGGHGSGTYTNTVISSASLVSLGTGSSPFNNTYAADGVNAVGVPAANVGSFNSLYTVPNGAWVLSVHNNTTFSNTGVVTSYSIMVNYTVPAPITWSPFGGLFAVSDTSIAYTGAVTNTVYARPHVTTNYIATATNGTCTNSSSITVNADTSLIVPIVTGVNTFCVGDTATLHDSTAGGTWSSGGISATVNAVTGKVTAINAGNELITYHYTSGSCSGSSSYNVTVNPLPVTAAIVGAGSLCTGSLLTLTDATPGGTWSSGATAVATINSSGLVTPISQGSAVITYTNVGAICTNRITATVNVFNAPSPMAFSPASASMCSGSAARLLTASGGVSGGSPAFINSTTIGFTHSSPAQSSVTVNGIPAGATITSVSAKFSGTSTFEADEDFDLRAPNGNILNLLNSLGGSSTGGFTNTTISSAGVTPVTSGAPPFNGTFAAQAASGVGFAGLTSNVTTWASLYSVPNGVWTLIGDHNFASGSGSVTSFTLTINYTVPSSVTWAPVTGLYTNSAGTTAYTGAATTTVYAAPTGTTVYTATSANGGCVSSGNDTVTVNPLPTAAISGTTAVCFGTATTVSFTGDNLDTVSYNINGGATQRIVLSNSGTASLHPTPTITSAYNLLSVKSVPGCITTLTGASATITVNSVPSATIGAFPSVCQPLANTSVSYSGATGGGNVYNLVWDTAATSAGFGNITAGTLLPSSVNIAIPSTTVAGAFNGTLTLSNGFCNSAAYPISVTTYLHPAATVTSAIQPCSGYAANIVFNGTPDAVISYRVDSGSAINATLTGGSYTLVTAASTVQHNYTLTNAHNPACSFAVDTVVYIHPILQQWLGGAIGSENDWNTPSNWACGYTPILTDDITIAPGAFVPVIGSGTSGTTRDLNLMAGASISISNTAVLNVKRNIINKGTVAGSGTLVLNGAAQQVMDSVGAINNLELNNSNGAVIHPGGRLTIGHMLTVTSGTLATGDSLVLGSSDTTSTASIAAIPASGAAVSGKVQVRQFIEGGYRRYRFLSHPFSTSISLAQLERYIDITGTGGAVNGFTSTASNAPSAFRYDPYKANSGLSYDPGWRPFTNISGAASDTNTIRQYQGIRIFMRGAKGEGLGYWFGYTPSATVIGMAGLINQGNQAVTLSMGSAADQDYNMVGNPYPSPVDLGSVLHNALVNSQIVGAAFYVWNPSIGASGMYQAIPLSTVSATPYYLPANTAFQVRADHDGAILNFTEGNKSASASTYLFKTQPESVSLFVYDANYHPWDMLYVKFNDAATDAEDRYLDATKPSGADFNFYSLSSEGKKMVIDSRPYAAGKVVPLGISSAYAQEFIIKAESVVVPNGGKIYLHDKLLQQYILLQQGTEYRFTVTKDRATQGDDRFELNAKPAGEPAATAFTVTMVPNPAIDQVKLSFTSGKIGKVSVRVLDMSGVCLYNKDLGMLQKGTLDISLDSFPAGVYMVEIASGDQKVVHRLLKE